MVQHNNCLKNFQFLNKIILPSLFCICLDVLATRIISLIFNFNTLSSIIHLTGEKVSVVSVPSYSKYFKGTFNCNVFKSFVISAS